MDPTVQTKNNAGSPVSEAAGDPWTSINQTDAIAACDSLGNGYRLISNDEWMTVTANAAAIASNWSGGSVGNGMIFIGHSDNDPTQACPADSDDSRSYVEVDCTSKALGGDDDAGQSRTHSLSNGSIVWDLAGNLREWTTYNSSVDKPNPRDNNYNEYTLPISGSTSLPLTRLIPTQGVKAFWNDAWNSAQGIGQGRIGTEGSGGALSRGGGFMGVDRNGLFRFRIDQGSDMTAATLGFRCTYSTPE
ncbi:MAG: SUMF1/EgtB/PvdO family nonheme iron enzyme [Oligoflexales bacterium]|nr:SUMF1/EgtB/PvdO family nonheme iron enzyme [Oligoflexales bacterium]